MGILMHSDYNQIIKVIKIEQNIAHDMYFGTNYTFDYQELKKGDILYCFQNKMKYIISSVIMSIDCAVFYKLNPYQENYEYIDSRNNIYWDSQTLKENMTFRKINNVSF